MKHDFSQVFETENEYWLRVLEIFEKNESYPKKKVSNRNLHHKFPRSFSKALGEPVDNDPDNLISLSLADHFLVHYYYYMLAKKGYRQSMATAFTFMAKKGLKYISPETAEAMAKDYAEAVEISKKIWTEEEKKKMSNRAKEYYNNHPEYREAISAKGRKHSEETKQKMSESAKKAATPELCKFRSESKIGKPHPHKGGFQSQSKRDKISLAHKGKSYLKTEFGRKFHEHFGITQVEDKKLYAREYNYYRKYGICKWEINNGTSKEE